MDLKAALVSSQDGEEQFITGFGVSSVDIMHTLEHRSPPIPCEHLCGLISGS